MADMLVEDLQRVLPRLESSPSRSHDETSAAGFQHERGQAGAMGANGCSSSSPAWITLQFDSGTSSRRP